jgi:hypothetical protein
LRDPVDGPLVSLATTLPRWDLEATESLHELPLTVQTRVELEQLRFD